MKAAIFDMDGTLLDSMEIWKNLGSRYLAKKGLKIDSEYNSVLFSFSMKRMAEELKNTYPELKDSDVLQELFNEVQTYYENESVIKEGVEAFLEKLKSNGVKMCVATVTDRRHVEAVLKRFDILKYFQFIMTVSEFGSTKEKPEIFYHCAKALGAEPSECVVFEDALYSAATAHAAGFKVIGVKDRHSEEDHEGISGIAEKFITSFSELL